MGRTELVCIHEAGHAVAVEALGGTVLDIWVDDWAGRVTYTGIPEWESDVIVTMAGWIAATEAFGERFGRVGTNRDRRAWQYRCRKHNAGKAMRATLRARTEELIRSRWAEVLELADRLLTAEEV